MKSPNRDKSGQITEIANNFIGGGPSDNQIHSRQREETVRKRKGREREREIASGNPLERRWRFSLSSIPRRSFSLFWRSSGCVSVCTFSCDTPCYRLHCKCATHSTHSQTHRRTMPERATFYGEIGRVCEFDVISRPRLGWITARDNPNDATREEWMDLRRALLFWNVLACFDINEMQCVRLILKHSNGIARILQKFYS